MFASGIPRRVDFVLSPNRMLERVVMMRHLVWFKTVCQDLRVATRSLRKSPSLVVVVILSLALGIGANSAIFSVIDTLFYRPLTYEHAEQLVTIWEFSRTHPDAYQQPPIR
jgi:hypothetical protein